MTPPQASEAAVGGQKHDFDDDAVCVRCGLDGAEWWHWKHNTYEGKDSKEVMPACGEVV